MTEKLKNSSFGIFRAKQNTIPYKGFEGAYLGTDSPGPTAYNGNVAEVKNQLSVTKSSQKYSMPKVSDRLLNNIQHTSLYLGSTVPRPNEILGTVSRNVRQLKRNSK